MPFGIAMARTAPDATKLSPAAKAVRRPLILVALLGSLNEQHLPSRLGGATCVRTRAPVPDLGSQTRRRSQVKDTNRDGHVSVGAIASPT